MATDGSERVLYSYNFWRVSNPPKVENEIQTLNSKIMDHLWWQKGIIYQIYPRSFMDGNGDGVGDLKGIVAKLDYVKWLGVNAVWISPIYPSPMADFGYDISDYTGIHPLFGTMDDFDELLKQAHNKELKVILDLVPNHTSIEHPWFKESRSSKDNPKRNWYLWRDPSSEGGPPNNWLSVFGGSAWEWDEKTEQYFYHAYLKEQPDLNWRNPEVQQELFWIMRFWLDKGIDGFRVDVMWHMIKDENWRNNPVNPDFKEGMSPYNQFVPSYSVDQPEVHHIVAKMREVMDRYDERLLIGEIYLPIHQLVTYYGMGLKGAHLPFNFQLITLPWDARQIALAIDQYEGALPEKGWPNWVLGNHDKSRIATRVGLKQAKIAAILLLTLRGTPTLYYGDEIGMQNVEISTKEAQDPWEKNVPGLGLGRDPVRTPMQWDDTESGGFTNGKPWLPLPDNYKAVNVKMEKESPTSILFLYHRLIELRNSEPALNVGLYKPVPLSGNLLAYTREEGGSKFLIALNLGDSREKFEANELNVKGKVILGTNLKREGAVFEGAIELEGNEGLVIRLV